MKIIIEIPEEQINEYVKKFLFNKEPWARESGLDLLIKESIKDNVDSSLSNYIEKQFPDVINKAIEKELVSVVEQKIPGWAKRRLKEMLESVRLANKLVE